jgi:hypothetical protein
VQDVALEGLPAALNGAQREQFDHWKSSDQVAWLFIDSVDEAKLDGIRLEKAFQPIADANEGVLSLRAISRQKIRTSHKSRSC